MSVHHQNSGGIKKSLPSALQISLGSQEISWASRMDFTIPPHFGWAQIHYPTLLVLLYWLGKVAQKRDFGCSFSSTVHQNFSGSWSPIWMSFEGGLLVISGERPLKTLRVWQGWVPPPSFICCAGELFLQSKTNHLPTLPTLTSTPSLNALYGFPLVMKMEMRDSSQIFSPQIPFSCCLIISDRNIWRSPAAQYHFWFTVGYKLNTVYCRGQIYKHYCNISILQAGNE